MSVYGSCHERKSKIVLVKNGSYTNESPSQTFMCNNPKLHHRFSIYICIKINNFYFLIEYNITTYFELFFSIFQKLYHN
jgi:hypothetical protein